MAIGFAYRKIDAQLALKLKIKNTKCNDSKASIV
jgi:hypothetical protein